MKVTNVIVVPHVHWDREWYFSCQESQVVAIRDFGEILDYLEKNPDYPSFVLDGQTSVLEEYLRYVPEDRNRVVSLVKSGRLHVGPWYTQTDEMVVGAEAIVRNLLYGTRFADDLGGSMRIGYLPDSFGQSAQIPMILAGFGISRFVFWRGQSQFCGTDKSQFIWESPDSSRVLALQMPLGYATGKYLPCDKCALRQRLGGLFSLMDEISPTPVAVLPNGHDQMPIQTDIAQVIDALREAFPDRSFSLGSYDDALDAVKRYAETNDDALPIVNAELLHGKRERVHRSIYSTRSDNKIMNTRLENRISRLVEPLLCVSSQIGINCPAELVRDCWRPLLLNDAHDSMGGCCSDVVNDQIRSRYIDADERSSAILRYYERYVTDAANIQDDGRLALFNLNCSPGERLVEAEVMTDGEQFSLVDAQGEEVPYDVVSTRKIDPGLVDRQIVAGGNYKPFTVTTIQFCREVPPMGYEVLGVREGSRSVHGVTKVMRGEQSFETDYYEVFVRDNATIDLVSKAQQRRYEGLFSLVCEGNDGDEYDFSPVRGGTRIYSSEAVRCEPEVCFHEHTIDVSFSYEMALPDGAEGWSDFDAAAKAKLGVHVLLRFNRGSQMVDVMVELDNSVHDLRVCLMVPLGVHVSSSLVSNQFGQICRPVVDPGMDVWETEGWAERPDGIYPFLDYVSAGDEKGCVEVVTDGPREYEVISENLLAITLLCSCGTLGKTGLERRPGRPSGISAETPGAQCMGRLSFSLGTAFLGSSPEDSPLGSIAAHWLTPVQSWQRFRYVPITVSPAKVSAPTRFSLFTQRDPSLVLTSVKHSEKEGTTLARFYNESDEPRELMLEGCGVRRRLTLAETPSVEKDLIVQPRSVITVELDLNCG